MRDHIRMRLSGTRLWMIMMVVNGDGQSVEVLRILTYTSGRNDESNC